MSCLQLAPAIGPGLDNLSQSDSFLGILYLDVGKDPLCIPSMAKLERHSIMLPAALPS